MSDLKKLLEKSNLGEYYSMFVRNKVATTEEFRKLYYTDLEKIGITDIKAKRLIYNLICQTKENNSDQTFLTEILLTKENNFFSIINKTEGMKEENTADTSKLIDLKYSSKPSNNINETTSKLFDKANESNVNMELENKYVKQVTCLTSVSDFSKDIYETKYGSKESKTDKKGDEATSRKSILNDSIINFTNLFYNSSNINNVENTLERKIEPEKQSDPGLEHIKVENVEDTKQQSNLYHGQLVKTVSQDFLQNNNEHDNNMKKIIVCVRKKPVNSGEKDVVDCNGKEVNVREIKTNYDLTRRLHCHRFAYDYTYDETINNEDIYKNINQITNHVLDGGNGSIIAYGQTGTGKTHTMLHPENGLVFLALKELLTGTADVYVSFFEIYNGHVFDLLDYREKLNIREKDSTVYLSNLTERKISTFAEGTAVISDGMSIRRRGSTGTNDESSRSHAIIKLSLEESRNTNDGNCMLFVDLAGSERGCDRNDDDAQTRNEGAEINKSLLALKECIRGINNYSIHLPFRQTKLTHILKNAFLGNGKTCVIATINPSGSCIDHTLNTLKYADRIKNVRPSITKEYTKVCTSQANDSLSKTVDELSSFFDRKIDNKRKIIMDSSKARFSFSPSLSRESSSDSKYLKSLVQKNINDANYVILLNKKIENMSKSIVKECQATSDIRVLRKTIEWLKRVEAKVKDVKLNN